MTLKETSKRFSSLLSRCTIMLSFLLIVKSCEFVDGFSTVEASAVSIDSEEFIRLHTRYERELQHYLLLRLQALPCVAEH